MLAIHREMIERAIYTPKGEWFQNPNFGFDYTLLYGEPSHSDIEEEVKRCMLELPAVVEVLSVNSMLMPNKNQKGSANLAISVDLLLEDNQNVSTSFTLQTGGV